jgi:Carboxypeptidase regulatory-like domain/TonB dependent receptor
MPTSFSRFSIAQIRAVLSLLLLIIVALVTPMSAQKDAGAIVGLVRDASGAIVIGAQVTIADADRGTTLTLTTNSDGEYVASPLRIGRYTVTVEKQGFKKAVAGPVQVNVQDRLSVDIKLEPGAATEIVDVTSQRPQLETETSNLSQLVDSQRINALPLNGRNYAQLALLGAGVSPAEPGSRTETSAGFSSNGARALQNNFLLDGIDNNANLGDVLNGASYVVQPSVDAIAEFKVETNAYSAEFGRGNGAIMNAVIKSGTNQFHGDVFEFLRNEKFDADNRFDIFGKVPYKQNQFGFTFGGPIVKNKTFFFGDYEGTRIRQALPQLVTVPTTAEAGGDFSALLTNNSTGNTGPVPGVVDCFGNATYYGEIFDARQVGVLATNPSGNCGVSASPIVGGVPTNILGSYPGDPNLQLDTVATNLIANGNLPGPTPNLPASLSSGGNFFSEPKRRETDDRFDIRVDQAFSQKDNFFARFSFGNSSNFLPSPFQTVLDGGGFQDGYSQNNSRGLAASEMHAFRPELINELRFGFNHLSSYRFGLNSNENLSQQYNFQGVPFGPNLGGLPSISFGNGDQTIGSAQYLPAIEKQYSYVIGDNLNWTRGRHAMKVGGELRFEQFTLLEPAAGRGYWTFGNDFTDNPGTLTVGTGGDAFATFLLGIPDTGGITSVNNVDYRRQIYAIYALDDFKVTPRLTLNLGLRYELFTTIKEANDNQGAFDFATQTIIVPRGQTKTWTPGQTLASELPITATGTRGLINPDLNNFAPRIGFAYQLADKLVLRGGYGVFYGGQESGPFSNPSPGFNPPFFSSQSFNTGCGAPTPACFVSPLGNGNANFANYNALGTAFVGALDDPNTPSLYSIDPGLRTPYTQQWHLGVEYQLPAQTVLQVTYAGSRGLKLYGFYNGNQDVPTADPNAPSAPRRPANNTNFPHTPVGDGLCNLNPADIVDGANPNCNPALDAGIDVLRSNTQSNYNSLQARLEKRFSHGLQFEAAYTYAHSLDNASSASLGSANNGDFRLQTNPNLEYGNSDFDIRQRFVLSYMYDLPFGRGKRFGTGASGVLNQFIGNWQLAGLFSAATGNWYTVSDIVSHTNADCGGTVVYNCARPNVLSGVNPNGHPTVPGTLFNTAAFDDASVQPGSSGNAGRNIVLGPGYKTWDTSLIKQFPIREQRHLEFRAEFFNILNHVNYLFQQFGAISVEPTSLELGTGSFGQPQAARNPREIQLALKFYF